MNTIPCPKLINRRTGAVIEVNSNPFSIGRGLTCNYILPSKTVSRTHCILEMTDNVWMLKDSSTNGTFVNGNLIKHIKSPPLNNNDVISLEINDTDSYMFTVENFSNEITDEQLCAIADTVLNEVECFNADPRNVPEEDHSGAAGLPNIPPTPDNLLHDHMYVAKTSAETAKKARTGRTPRPILGCGSRRDAETLAPSSSRHEGNSVPYQGRTLRNRANLSHVIDRVASAAQSSGDAGVSTAVGVGDFTMADSNVATSSVNTGGGTESVAMEQDSGGVAQSSGDGASSVQPGPSTDKPSKKVLAAESGEKLNKDQQQDNYEVMENELQCVICSELFVKAVTLNCSHSFCKYCIGIWGKNKSDCPICRTKITSVTATIVLDNVIEKVIESSNEETKQRRRSLMEERKRQEEADNPPAQEQQGRGRGRGRGRRAPARRGRGGRNQDLAPRINVLDPVAINIGALTNNNVIEVSSDSDWSSDTESTSSNDLRNEYEYDDWYNRGRHHWGGYGHCYRCGSPTHWANNCPNR